MPDPRDPAVEQIGRYSTAQFNRDLMASEHVTVAAEYLRHLEWLLNFGEVPDTPLHPTHARPYRDAACLAVRYLSVPDNTVAESCAARWALNRWDDLQRELAGPEATRETRNRIVRQFVYNILAVYTQRLISGPHIQTRLEELQKQALFHTQEPGDVSGE